MNPLNLINIKKTWTAFLSAILLSTLVACSGGHNTEDADDTGVVGENALLSISVTDINGNVTNSITSGNQLSLTATLTTSSGAAIEGERVEFTTSLGSLNATSRLTDASGQATVSFDSSAVASGVVTFTTSATVDTEELSIDSEIEVLQAVVEVEGDPSVSITLKESGTSTNSIQEDETAQLGIELLDADNNPIADAIVTFSAELGQLSATTALTNSLGTAEVTLTPIAEQLGAGLATASVTINDTTYVETKAYEIVSDGVVDPDTQVQIGYFDDNNNFVAGQVQSDIIDDEGNTSISAGATLGLSIVVVDQDLNRITSPTNVSFTSTCVSAGSASIDDQVTTINGEAQTTYQDISCAGSMGNEDEVIATVRVNSSDLTASRTITLQAEDLGSIEFVSASPESIVLKGTGGQGKQETATLTFLVKGELGNPLNQQNVSFSLNTDVGGLALASSNGVTNAQGLVSVKVISGTVPTAVRVTAMVTNEEGTEISTQSDLLSVNTGLPDQDSLTLALTTVNPEARNFVETVTVVAYLADSFNNPVPDGTTVNFTTEGGSIEPSCVTSNGNCSVEWTSIEPYQDNHRVTILATAEGHEYFVDVNGNNVYDDADGSAQNASLSNEGRVVAGFDRIGNLSSGFIDMPEAWRDDNEDGVYDSGELFIDADNDGAHTIKNDLFNGPQCDGSSCATTNFITIRKATVLITSGSAASYRLTDNTGGQVIRSNYDDSATNSAVSIARGSSNSFSLQVADEALQTMPSGTIISISSTVGDLIGGNTYTVPNTRGTSDPDGYGGVTLSFVIANNLSDEEIGSTGGIEVTVTTPRGIETTFTAVVTVE